MQCNDFSQLFNLPQYNGVNPLVPGAHYSELQDKPFSLQTQRLDVDLKYKMADFYFLLPGL